MTSTWRPYGIITLCLTCGITWPTWADGGQLPAAAQALLDQYPGLRVRMDGRPAGRVCRTGLMRGRPQADWSWRLRGGHSTAADAVWAGDVRYFFRIVLDALPGVWYNGDSPIAFRGNRTRREGAVKLSSRHKMLLTLVLRMGLSLGASPSDRVGTR
jgi:hypothetical protein